MKHHRILNSTSNPAKWIGVNWLAAVMAASVAHSAVLVGLSSATALYDSDVKGIVDDGSTAGSKSGIPVLGTAQLVLGATFNIAFTPTAADLDRAVVGAARTVLLIEVGGTSNGIGLYLIDGVPTLLSKQTSNDKTVPASLNDTSLPAIAVQSPIGKLNAGTAYSFSGSWNQAGTLELIVQPDGGSGIVTDLILDPGNVTAGFTIEAVVRRSPGAVGAKPVIIAQRGTGGRFILSSTASGSILTDLAGGTIKEADQTLHDDTWAHLVVVVDKLHTEIRWYRDGVQIGSTADGTNPDGSTFDPHLLLESSTGEWIIGIGKAYTDNYWKGSIDEIAVYNRVLDDPNNDNDHADSRIAAHRNAWWEKTSGLLDFVSSKTTANAGDPVQLLASVGADVTSVTIDHGVGPVPPLNGSSSVTVNPTVTTTYQVSTNGPGGPFTRSVTVTVLQYQSPTVKGFIATKLGTAGGVRLHWKVTQGEAPNPVTLTFKAGETVLYTSTELQGFFDVDAGTAARLIQTFCSKHPQAIGTSASTSRSTPNSGKAKSMKLRFTTRC